MGMESTFTSVNRYISSRYFGVHVSHWNRVYSTVSKLFFPFFSRMCFFFLTICFCAMVSISKVTIPIHRELWHTCFLWSNHHFFKEINLPCLQFKQCLGVGKARGLRIKSYKTPPPYTHTYTHTHTDTDINTHKCLLLEEEAQLYLLPRYELCAVPVKCT